MGRLGTVSRIDCDRQVLNEHGKVIVETEVMSEPEVLVRWLGNLERSVAVIGLEAEPLSQWLHRGLDRSGPGCSSDGNTPVKRCFESHAD